MDYVGERSMIRSPVLSFPKRVGRALTSSASRAARWVVEAGHKDRPCGRCGTLVRAGQRQCVLCSYDFSI
jgi:hypothetical protein